MTTENNLYFDRWSVTEFLFFKSDSSKKQSELERGLNLSSAAALLRSSGSVSPTVRHEYPVVSSRLRRQKTGEQAAGRP